MDIYKVLVEHGNTIAELYQCPYCPEYYLTDFELYCHLHIHKKYTCFKCLKCGAQFKTLHLLQEHRKMHVKMSNSDWQNTCHICSKIFRYIGTQKQHFVKYPPEKDCTCFKCGKKFHTNKKLKMHMFIEESESYCCYSCKVSYADAATLKQHVSESHGVVYNKHTCKICGKRMACRTSYRHHLLQHASDRIYLFCEICGKKLTSRTGLAEHRRVHSGEKPYTCEICGKTFAKSYTLKVHLRSHSGAKPYKCKTCGKQFTQSSTLTIHRRSHTGEKPYSCESCDDRFISKSSLELHRKSKHKTS